jgi:transposase
MDSHYITRLRQFRQLKNEIQGSKNYLIVGIDVAKSNHHAFMGTAKGNTLVKKLIFENNIEGFSKLLDRVKAISSQNQLSKVVFGLEPTGDYHKPLSRYLVTNDLTVVLVSGKAVKSNRELLDNRWDKHDTKDAANIADLISQGKCLFYDVPSVEIEELRDLLSLRRRLKKDEHALRMRIRNNTLAKYFPELDRYYSVCESEGLAIVQWCFNPAKIASMDFQQFFKLVTGTQRGVAQKMRLKKIHSLASETIGCPINPAAEFQASFLVQKLKDVRLQMKQINELIESICTNLEAYRWLLTIPGFGPYISSVVLARIADPWRFQNRNQILRLAGYDLCADRSGKSSDRAVPVISKRGNAELRYALYQAAFIASTKNKYFIQYFTNILRGRERERGIKTKMRVKLGAKMLIIAWTLMKKEEAFNPKYLSSE